MKRVEEQDFYENHNAGDGDMSDDLINEKTKIRCFDQVDRDEIDSAMRSIIERLDRCGYKQLISGWRVETPQGRVFTLKMKSYAKKGSEAEKKDQLDYSMAKEELNMTDHPKFKGYRSYDVMVAHSDEEGEWITVEAESKHDAETQALKKFPDGEVLEVNEQ